MQPLNGLLSLHGRKAAKGWTCLVCSASHSDDSHDKTCGQCGRQRVPSWLLDTNGLTIFPGALIECSRHAATYIPGPPPAEPAEVSLSPPHNTVAKSTASSTGRSPLPNKTTSRATSSLVSPRLPTQSNSAAVSRPASPTKGVGTVSDRQSRAAITSAEGTSDQREVAQTSTPTRSAKRGIAAQISPVHNGPRGWGPAKQTSNTSSRTTGKATATSPTGRYPGRGNKQTAHEASSRALKAAFEAQPGDTRLIMVVAVYGVRPPASYTPRSLDGYCAIMDEDEESTENGGLSLVKVTIDPSKASTLEVLDERLHQRDYDMFINFGLCGRCDRTYRVMMGQRHTQSKADRDAAEAQLDKLRERVREAEGRKRAFRAAKAYHATLEQTRVLHGLHESIANIQRKLELPIVMSCPFCLWRCDSLFVSQEEFPRIKAAPSK